MFLKYLLELPVAEQRGGAILLALGDELRVVVLVEERFDDHCRVVARREFGDDTPLAVFTHHHSRKGSQFGQRHRGATRGDGQLDEAAVLVRIEEVRLDTVVLVCEIQQVERVAAGDAEELRVSAITTGNDLLEVDPTLLIARRGHEQILRVGQREFEFDYGVPYAWLVVHHALWK
jgi:hypothetical protein